MPTTSGEICTDERTLSIALVTVVVVLCIVCLFLFLLYTSATKKQATSKKHVYEYVDDFVPQHLLAKTLKSQLSSDYIEMCETPSRRGTGIFGNKIRSEANIYEIVKTFTVPPRDVHKSTGYINMGDIKETKADADRPSWTGEHLSDSTREAGKLGANKDITVNVEVHNYTNIMSNSHASLDTSPDVRTNVKVDPGGSELEISTLDPGFGKEIRSLLKRDVCDDTTCFDDTSTPSKQDKKQTQDPGCNENDVSDSISQGDVPFQSKDTVNKETFTLEIDSDCDLRILNRRVFRNKSLIIYNKAYRQNLNDYKKFNSVVGQRPSACSQESFYITPIV